MPIPITPRNRTKNYEERYRKLRAKYTKNYELGIMPKTAREIIPTIPKTTKIHS